VTCCAQSGCKLARWRGPVCYTHTKIADGFVFDGKSFVKDDHRATDTPRGKRPSVVVGRRNSGRVVPGQQLSIVALHEDPEGALDGKTPARERFEGFEALAGWRAFDIRENRT
jgi:hypothetical protein